MREATASTACSREPGFASRAAAQTATQALDSCPTDFCNPSCQRNEPVDSPGSAFERGALAPSFDRAMLAHLSSSRTLAHPARATTARFTPCDRRRFESYVELRLSPGLLHRACSSRRRQTIRSIQRRRHRLVRDPLSRVPDRADRGRFSHRPVKGRLRSHDQASAFHRRGPFSGLPVRSSLAALAYNHGVASPHAVSRRARLTSTPHGARRTTLL